MAFLAAALVAAPVCALCLLGPTVLGAVIAWVSGLDLGRGLAVIAILSISAVLAVSGIARGRRTRAAVGEPRIGVSERRANRSIP